MRVCLAPVVALTLLISPQKVLASAAELLEAMRLADVINVMREEGIDYGSSLQADMFPGEGTLGWRSAVSKIYATERMYDTIEDALSDGMSDQSIAEATDFFRSERGTRIVELEVSAREALLDEAVEAASVDALKQMQRNDDPRLGLLRQFIAENDLVEANVVGAMNSNIAFYKGLQSGNAFAEPLTETQILSDVWSQEGAIRADTLEWVESYLAMAYQPLPDADLETYIAFSKTTSGKELNRALFAGFDVVFTTISEELGLAAAVFMQGEDT